LWYFTVAEKATVVVCKYELGYKEVKDH